jgi:hypothetical protein
MQRSAQPKILLGLIESRPFDSFIVTSTGRGFAEKQDRMGETGFSPQLAGAHSGETYRRSLRRRPVRAQCDLQLFRSTKREI